MSRSGRTDLHSRTTIRSARNSSMWSSRLCCRLRSTQPQESSSTGLRWAPDLSHLPPLALSSGRSQAVPPLISCAPSSYHRDQGTSRRSPSIGKAIISPLSVRACRQTVRFLNTTDSPLSNFVASGTGQTSVWIHQTSRLYSQAPFKNVKGAVQCVAFHPLKPHFFVAVNHPHKNYFIAIHSP